MTIDQYRKAPMDEASAGADACASEGARRATADAPASAAKVSPSDGGLVHEACGHAVHPSNHCWERAANKKQEQKAKPASLEFRLLSPLGVMKEAIFALNPLT